MDFLAVDSAVLRYFYSDIQKAIVPSIVGIAALLYEEGVVAEKMEGEAGLTKPLIDSSASIMRAVETAVKRDPKCFWVLVAVLEKFPMTVGLATRMRRAVGLHGEW